MKWVGTNRFISRMKWVGRYRYLKTPNGYSFLIQDMYNRKMEEGLEGLNSVACTVDNLIIFGKLLLNRLIEYRFM